MGKRGGIIDESEGVISKSQSQDKSPPILQKSSFWRASLLRCVHCLMHLLRVRFPGIGSSAKFSHLLFFFGSLKEAAEPVISPRTRANRGPVYLMLGLRVSGGLTKSKGLEGYDPIETAPDSHLTSLLDALAEEPITDTEGHGLVSGFNSRAFRYTAPPSSTPLLPRRRGCGTHADALVSG